MDERRLQCGEVARRCGVSPDTVRYYERLGLVSRADRTPAGYRLYPAEVCRRVRLVRGALELGFTLRELVGVMAVRDRGGSPCSEVRRLGRGRLHEVEEEIRRLLQFRRRLKSVLESWDARLAEAPAGQPARLLESLVKEDGSDDHRADARHPARPRRAPGVSALRSRHRGGAHGAQPLRRG